MKIWKGKRCERRSVFRGIAGFCIFAAIAAFCGLEPANGQPPEGWTTGIAYDVTPEAKITKISMSTGMTESGEMLIYEVGIKNVSNQPHRFKLTIYTTGVEPVAGYYPLTAKKEKPLAVEPGAEQTLKLPVFLKKMPEGFAMVVRTVEE